ncbi:uncharacterized protein LOC130988724 isoform X2 [Salvia miltiorrhiza]|uniref:uncharacterized protein LOC130988724 isoform X2 n=1 Tax=Salvia miltiorrhiza TaxID=226208 RepID=UPI0025AD3A20|nr:uncharacterized protein LOC130988724 isoform X2 [Salvia miltiorrhiza]
MEGAEVVKNERDEASSSSPAKPQSQVPSSMAGYDPKRIPSSVFSNKSGTEWSLTSNDSLFSIQMGNNSFSNDYAIMYGKSGDFDPSNNLQLKSGELPRLDEWSNNNRRGKSSEVNSLPPVMEQEESSVQSGESSSRAEKKEGGSPYVSECPPPATFKPPVGERQRKEGRVG